MKVSYEWLRDFTDTPRDVKHFAHLMTLSGSKVEALDLPLENIQKVVVAKILSIQKHPDADKLQVCQVDAGQEELLQIVTAARNIKEGDYVPLALDGAILSDGMKIKTGKLRGVVSEGMFCSLKELQLPKEAFPDAIEEGIFILDPNFVIGENVLTCLGYHEPSLEFEITSNRPDCFSVEGLAREAAITCKQEFKACQPYFQAKSSVLTEEKLSLKNQVPEVCPLYLARYVSDVRIAPSPSWLVRRLLQAGLRPINNIVDISNYVMLELGHPMHAFDADKLEGNQIQIRYAHEGESFQTLDEKEWTLRSCDTVIADEKKAIALAGVMGGKNSEVDENTKNLILEMAYFKAPVIRKTASHFGIRTESSSRFERKVDARTCRLALDRACQLIEQLACGKVSPSLLSYETELEALPIITFSTPEINRFLGTDLSGDFMLDLFEKLGCKLLKKEALSSCSLLEEEKNPEMEEQGERKRHYDLQLEMPSYRPDLQEFVDLVEEVARFYDYNKIPKTLLSTAETTLGVRSDAQLAMMEVKQSLVHQSYYEAYSNSLSSPNLLEKFSSLLTEEQKQAWKNELVFIRNAALDSSCLRTTILPDLLNSLSLNAKRQQSSCRLFEMGRIYVHDAMSRLALTQEPSCTCSLNEPTGQNEELSLPKEPTQLALAVYQQDLGKHKQGELFFELKYLAEEILGILGISTWDFLRPHDLPEEIQKQYREFSFFHPHRSAVLMSRKKILGVLGYIHPKLCQNFEVPTYSASLILYWDELLPLLSKKKTQKPLPKYPTVSRDLALVVKEEVMWKQVEDLCKKYTKPYLENIELFDVYRGEHIKGDEKSMAFRLTFRSSESTLTDQEVQNLLDQVLQKAKDELGAHLRS